MLEIKKRWMRSGSKSVLLIIAVILLTCGMIGGTMAWMYVKTEPVSNTFTYGDIDLSLEETDTQIDGDNNRNTNTYVFTETEGDEDGDNAIAKDPTVVIGGGSENCWIFVKIEESANFSDFFTYEVADGWTTLPESGVYFREAAASSEAQSFYVLECNAVYAKGALSQSALDALDEDSYPTLDFRAYAIQKDSSIADAAAAWELVK